MAAETLTRGVARQLALFFQELGRARRGSVRGVHQARVASRRVREGLGALDGVLPAETPQRARRALRRLGRRLGAVRECDVTLALAIAEGRGHQWPSAPVAAVVASLRAERMRHHRRLRAAVTEKGWRNALRAVRAGLGPLPDPASMRRAITAARERRRRRGEALLAAVAELGTLYVPDHLHAVRVATKKLRYSLEWEQRAGRRQWLRERRALEAAQEQLGEWHDRLVLQSRLDRLRRTAELPRAVNADLRQMAGQLERECRTRHAAILELIPTLARVAKAAAR